MTVLQQTRKPIRFVAMEITGQCPLQCEHCYAESGPTGTTGDMHETHWLSTIDQAADHGVEMVQFIGGEPMTHRSLATLIMHALARGLKVEIFSNLLVLPNKLKQVFTLPGVQMATSYYSADPDQHDQITKVKRSHKKTTDNIRKVLEWGVPLRVGLIHRIDAIEDQDVEGARRVLEEMGVSPESIGYDEVREIGRGIRGDQASSMKQLCGGCGNGGVAIFPGGEVQACVMARFQEPVGNVLQQSLSEILEGAAFENRQIELGEHFAARFGRLDLADPCAPKNVGKDCWPVMCDPYAGCAPDKKFAPAGHHQRVGVMTAG